MIPPHPIDEVDEVGVDLVLDERRGGGRAAVADLAGLEQDGADALPGEPVGHQGAGDAAADDGDVAAEVSVESGVGRGEAVEDGPEGVAAGQVHGPTYSRPR